MLLAIIMICWSDWCSSFSLNCVIGFVTCSNINRRNLPIKGTIQELLLHHPVHTQKIYVFLGLSPWHQPVIRLEGLHLLGKKTLMSLFKIAVVIQKHGFPRQLYQATSAVCQWLWQAVYDIWESVITLSLGHLSWNRKGYTDLQTLLHLAWW